MLSTAFSNELKNPLKSPSVMISAVIYFILWIALAIDPPYRPEWLLENYLVFMFWGLIGFSFYKLRLSDVSYILIFFYLSLHSFGAHFGYNDVPFGFWFSQHCHLDRPNAYDRIVHFSFGFLLTYPLYEILKRYSKFTAVWLLILPTEFILSYSAAYELIEAFAAWTLPAKDYDAFVGLQGDIWDGYKDMLCALIGSIFIMILNVARYISRKWRS